MSRLAVCTWTDEDVVQVVELSEAECRLHARETGSPWPRECRLRTRMRGGTEVELVFTRRELVSGPDREGPDPDVRHYAFRFAEAETQDGRTVKVR